MKHLAFKIIAFIIAAAMLLSSMSLAVLADGNIVNLYDRTKASPGIPNTSSATGPNTYNENYYVTKLIEVNAGDKIYFGPCMASQGYYLTSYDASGNVVSAQIKKDDVRITSSFSDNEIICYWTVPNGTASFKMATSQMFADSTLITKNQAFDVDTYFKYMESESIDISYLKSTETDIEEIVNVFPTSDKTFEGRTDASQGEVATGSFRTSDYIPVEEGDVIYIAAAVSSQGYHLTLYNESKQGTVNVSKNYMVMYEDLGRGFAVYSYRIRPGTAYVRAIVATGVYDDGIQLVTINQPFTGEQYRKMFNLNITDEPAKPSSPLNGLSALYMGDSISYGVGDSLTYTHIGRAWAGRIQEISGLIATNASVSGAKASYIDGDDTAKWLFNQYTPYKNQKFDVIVMQGGVNDARNEREVGTVLDTNSEAELKSNLTTYAGGLQYLFYNVVQTQPNAALFFIANHHLDGHTTGRAKDMSAYFDVAKQLCEKYGIIFIDLYNNKELNDKLETATTKYFPDTLHLNAAGYDILTPYVLTALETGVDPNYTETAAGETSAVTGGEEHTSAPQTSPEGTEPEITASPAIPEDTKLINPYLLIFGAAIAIIAAAAGVVIVNKRHK